MTYAQQLEDASRALLRRDVTLAIAQHVGRTLAALAECVGELERGAERPVQNGERVL